MAWLKRVILFSLVNILVVVTISIVLQLLGIRPYLQAGGLDYGSLAVFCLVWGFGGAFISLALSRVMAKRMLGVQVIDPARASGEERALVETVHRLAERAGLPARPEVGIYESPELNAFATGPTKARALVAVSTGLLAAMSRDEAEGVLGHEITHVANGDMVTMTLIQGVINAFVMFLARALAFAAAQAFARGDREQSEGTRRMIQMAATVLLEILLSVLGMLVVAWFSRRREFRADAGSAKLAGRERMIAALQALQRRYEPVDAQPALASLKIAGRSGGLLAFFATHPPLEDRLAALRAGI